MSEASTPEPDSFAELREEVDNVSEDDLYSFLGFIGNRPCEACGAEKWFIVEDTKVTTWSAYDENGHVPVMNVCCGNCGNLRSFAWARVKHFVTYEKHKYAQ